METNKINLNDPRIISGPYGYMRKDVDVLPELFEIDKELFPEGFFSQIVQIYLFYNTECDSALEDEITKWLDDDKKKHWFEIKKDKDGIYYCLGGDEEGLKYFCRIAGISIIAYDNRLGFREDSKYYYVNIQPTFTLMQYNKKEWTLKTAIISTLACKDN